MAEKTVFQSQLEDTEIVRNLKQSGVLQEAVQEIAGTAEAASIGTGDLESAIESLRAGNTDLNSPDTTEAIVMAVGYPSLLIRNGEYEEPKDAVWKSRLNPSRSIIKGVIRCVGRIDLKGHPNRKWAGTSWLVDQDVMITNRHVAVLFAEMRQNRSPQFMQGVQAFIDFNEEIDAREQVEHLIRSIVHIEPMDSKVDLALLRLSPGTTAQLRLTPIPLSTNLTSVEFLGVVGYPANDLRNNPRDAFARYFGDKFDVKRFAPGKVMNLGFSSETFTHNCTTLGGNSGSVVFDVGNGAAIGLHFGGNALVQNYAVKAEHILDRLRKNQIWGARLEDTGGDEARRARPEHFDDRDGYQADFIGKGSMSVPLPILNSMQVAKAARTKDGEMVLKYRHFSAVLNKERRLAFYSAANLDGNDLRNPRRLPRFELDPRLDEEVQTGEIMYRANDLDRGHLVRRLDPCWGGEEAAKQANRDTMFFPNIAPQHKNLNQKLWNELEDHILQLTDEKDARVSVLVGCLFSEDDPVQRPSGIRVPMEFWKVVVSASRGRGRGSRRGEAKLQAQAFVMSQRDLVKPGDLEIVFGRGFETFQITVEQLERLTGLDFHKLKDADTFGLSDEDRETMMTESAADPAPVSARHHFKVLYGVDDIVM